ncbi:helix-turn-helix transcriptional regulator [Microtetraspora sp. AC03309]|uniref:helix-turn-helix domain-containing protein n=1 Tax=Microtetraspora sp. AC03309 TaxID=2779376 RepID=UPI0027E1A3E3|nr:helix-turn-helix transcriptional regulator [Microtetraspora sp. AC03309]MCC5574821.1 helix-turn-helix transcriptional regulator [Microtetraspora sp. AC03309]
MVREPLSIADRLRGERLGDLLREARGSRSITDVALRAGISPETLRKIERGRIPTPAFFTVVAVAGALELSLDGLLAQINLSETAAEATGEHSGRRRAQSRRMMVRQDDQRPGRQNLPHPRFAGPRYL